MSERKEGMGMFYVGAFIGGLFALIVLASVQCGTQPTCRDCVDRCKPIDVKSCNVDRINGEWRPTCECVDKMEEK